MKTKTIAKVIAKKMADWYESIEDEAVRRLAQDNTIVTGGCIASMLLQEKVNDFDVYLRTKEAVVAVAEYYVKRFTEATQYGMKVDVTDDRVRITTDRKRNNRGETWIDKPDEIEETYDETEQAAQESDQPNYKPVFLSTNAISLSKRVQIVLRFYGEPEEIHKNYDFVHCTNYWTAKTGIVLHQAALESILTKELRYVGSKYPVCSLFRLRKFIARQWTINAGQILKIAFQVSELNLSDLTVLEDQLTGVDVAYFMEVMAKLKEADPTKVNSAYLVEILDRMF